MSEHLDVFDNHLNYLGIATREQAHKQGLWHQTFHCWIVIEENEQKQLLFQIRHPNKDFPNLLDISAAGHLLAGETPLDGIRELEEELGIEVDVQDLTSVGVMKQIKEKGNFLDYEHCHVFLLNDHRPITNYIVQEDEVKGLVKINLLDFKRLIMKKTAHVHAQGFVIEQGKRFPVTINVRKNQFVPHDDDYYNRICAASLDISK